jgi:hypothetical protein
VLCSYKVKRCERFPLSSDHIVICGQVQKSKTKIAKYGRFQKKDYEFVECLLSVCRRHEDISIC